MGGGTGSGGGMDGSFLDFDVCLTTPLAELHGWDLTEIYYASPLDIGEAIIRAKELENPELALFMTGILAARMLEQCIDTGTRRRPNLVHPSGRKRVEYSGALQCVLPNIELPLLPG